MQKGHRIDLLHATDLRHGRVWLMTKPNKSYTTKREEPGYLSQRLEILPDELCNQLPAFRFELVVVL